MYHWTHNSPHQNNPDLHEKCLFQLKLVGTTCCLFSIISCIQHALSFCSFFILPCDFLCKWAWGGSYEVPEEYRHAQDKRAWAGDCPESSRRQRQEAAGVNREGCGSTPSNSKRQRVHQAGFGSNPSGIRRGCCGSDSRRQKGSTAAAAAAPSGRQGPCPTRRPSQARRSLGGGTWQGSVQAITYSRASSLCLPAMFTIPVLSQMLMKPLLPGVAIWRKSGFGRPLGLHSCEASR